MASVKETRMAQGFCAIPVDLPRAARERLHFCDGRGEGLPQAALRLT
jgi:hypothetical protein